MVCPTRSMRSEGQRRRACAAAAIVGAELVGSCLLGVAMAKYPGGTSIDHAALGHHFWRNFLCDLTEDVALDGRANPGAWEARIGLFVLAASLTAFWWIAVPGAGGQSRFARWAKGAGSLSFGIMTAILVFPQLFDNLHSAGVIAAALGGLLAATCTAAMQTGTHPTRVPAALGMITVAGALVTTGLYVQYLARGGPAPLSLTAGQKLTLATALLWIGATCAVPATKCKTAGARPPPGPRAGPTPTTAAGPSIRACARS